MIEEIEKQVEKEILDWEKKYGKVKYSPEFCKKNKISKERNKLC